MGYHFISLSRKIDFTRVSNLPGRKSGEIFKGFKSINRYYIQQGFRIETVHVDGEFHPLQEIIQGIPGGPRVNLTSAYEHVHTKYQTKNMGIQGKKHGYVIEPNL